MDESATEEEAFYLEQVTLEDDEDDEFDYTEVVVEDDEDEGFGEDAAEDEDLEQALKTMKTREDGLPVAPVEAAPRSAITRRPEVLDDFIRNVLLKMGMVSAARACESATATSHPYACVRAPQNETLDMFQREWYRLQGEGKLSEVDMGTVPDIYLRNQQLGARRPCLHAGQPACAPQPSPAQPSPTGPRHATPTPTAALAAPCSRRPLSRAAVPPRVRSRPAQEHAGLHRADEP